MFNVIQNLTGRQVILRLNNGRSLFIGPGSASGKVPGAELKDNPMVKKLRDRRVIDLLPVEDKKDQTKPKPKPKGGK